MYLAETLDLDGRRYPVCGVLPFSTRMPAPLKLAYVEVTTSGGPFGAGRTARGHLFHRSEISGEPKTERCYQLRTSRGDETEEGYLVGNVLATYSHLHFASEPGFAGAFVERCQAFRASARQVSSAGRQR
jgi:cobyrinic acid a,c-diamide synthase